jgi:RND family efflux transporter MFP subunit
MTYMRMALVAALGAVLAACGGEPADAGMPPLPALDTVVVGTGEGVATGQAWDGVVEAVQRADLGAQTHGRVTRVTVDVDDRVRAGEILVRLTAVEQQAGADTARAQVRAAEAAAAEAESNYRRFASLADGQYVPRAQLDQARAGRDRAVAARDAARAQLSLAARQADYTVVRAPFAGVVSARYVEPGESIAPGQPLLSLYVPGALRIEVQVPQSTAAAIADAGSARVQFADGRSTDAAEVIVHPVADPRTHSVGVRVLLPETGPAPVPGTTAKVVFPIGAGDALSIPAGALVQRGELTGVYVVDGNRIALRQLRTGARTGDRVEVVSGLQRGETIAADPVAAVQALVAQRDAVEARDD